MDIKRINFLRSELEAERISYGEVAEIESAFEQLDPATLRDRPENATAGDMLDELESAARAAGKALGVTDAERVAYTLTRLERWAGNFDANAESARASGDNVRAGALRIRANEIRDIIKMLDGTEDAHIRTLTPATAEPEAFVLAEMNTGYFNFLALATDEAHARRIVTQAWNRHAREFGASLSAADVLGDANFYSIKPGDVLRDGDSI